MAINVSMVQGESRLIDVTVTDADGTATDITGATIVWKAGVSPFGTASLTKAGAIVDADEGLFRVTIEPADTASLSGVLFHWAEIVLSDSSVIKPFLGTFTVSPQSVGGVTVEAFKVRYPEFAEVSDALISMMIAEAADEVGDTWLERDQVRGRMLLVAHKLVMEGEPERTATGVGIGSAGVVKRDKVGDVETEYAGMGSVSGSGSSLGYDQSAYGREFAALMRKNFPAIAVV